MFSMLASVGGSLLSGAMQGKGARKAAKNARGMADWTFRQQEELLRQAFNDANTTYSRGADEAGDITKLRESHVQQNIQATYNDIVSGLAPWAQQGEQAFNELIAVRGELTAPFTEEKFRADPGYQFRVAEGNRATTNYLAGQGMRESGAAIDEIMRRNQGYADQTYNDAWQRYMAENQNRFGVLNQLAGYGQQAHGAIANAKQARGNAQVQNVMSSRGDQANIRLGLAQQAGNARQALGSQLVNAHSAAWSPATQATTQAPQHSANAMAGGMSAAIQNYLTGSMINQGLPQQQQPAGYGYQGPPVTAQLPQHMQPYNYFAGGAIPGRGIL